MTMLSRSFIDFEPELKLWSWVCVGLRLNLEIDILPISLRNLSRAVLEVCDCDVGLSS